MMYTGKIIQPEKNIRPVDRFYVIGDIHGCINELRVLLDEIVINHGFDDNCHLLFVGDYIDRGEDSKAVVELLIRFAEGRKNVTFLKGNHEDMFLAYCGMPGFNGEYFLHNGGTKTQADYDLPFPHQLRNRDDGVTKLFDLLPKEHQDFYNNLLYLTTYVNKNGTKYAFAHAGIDPQEYITDQDTHRLLWQRTCIKQLVDYQNEGVEMDFRCLDFVSVHGHTPMKRAYIEMPYEINVDTGCVFNDMIIGEDQKATLTCLIIDGEDNMKTVEVGAKTLNVIVTDR